jgi:hypothetical protein
MNNSKLIDCPNCGRINSIDCLECLECDFPLGGVVPDQSYMSRGTDRTRKILDVGGMATLGLLVIMVWISSSEIGDMEVKQAALEDSLAESKAKTSSLLSEMEVKQAALVSKSEDLLVEMVELGESTTSLQLSLVGEIAEVRGILQGFEDIEEYVDEQLRIGFQRLETQIPKISDAKKERLVEDPVASPNSEIGSRNLWEEFGHNVSEDPYRWAFYLAAALAVLLWIRPSKKKRQERSAPAPTEASATEASATGRKLDEEKDSLPQEPELLNDLPEIVPKTVSPGTDAFGWAITENEETGREAKAFAFPGLVDELKKNLSFQRRSDLEMIITDGELYLQFVPTRWLVGEQPPLPSSSQTGEPAIAIHLGFDSHLQQHQEAEKTFLALKESDLFTKFEDNEGVGQRYGLDFGQDVNSAAALGSKILMELIGYHESSRVDLSTWTDPPHDQSVNNQNTTWDSRTPARSTFLFVCFIFLMLLSLGQYLDWSLPGTSPDSVTLPPVESFSVAPPPLQSVAEWKFQAWGGRSMNHPAALDKEPDALFRKVGKPSSFSSSSDWVFLTWYCADGHVRVTGNRLLYEQNNTLFAEDVSFYERP